MAKRVSGNSGATLASGARPFFPLGVGSDRRTVWYWLMDGCDPLRRARRVASLATHDVWSRYRHDDDVHAYLLRAIQKVTSCACEWRDRGRREKHRSNPPVGCGKPMLGYRRCYRRERRSLPGNAAPLTLVRVQSAPCGYFGSLDKRAVKTPTSADRRSDATREMLRPAKT